MKQLQRICAIVVLACALPALAQDTSSAKAKEFFQQGTAAFNLGKFADAVKAWEEGYKLRPDPIFLYNIAQAHRLADNHEQAIFFYKSYLRNSPSARNKDEVQMRLDQLQKLVDEKRKARDAQPDTTLAQTGNKPADPTPTTTTTPTQPTTTTHPTTTTTTTNTTTPTTTTTTTTTSTDQVITKPVTIQKARNLDISVAGGVNIWALGVPSGVEPAAAVSLSAGYTAIRKGRIEFRIGAKVGYTYAQDLSFTAADQRAFVSFISVLADPEVRINLWKEKLYFLAGVGLGAQLIIGLEHGSGLLEQNAKPSGVFAHFEARPSIGVEYRVIPMLAVFLMPQLIISPAPNEHFKTSLLMRLDVSVGASIRL